MADGAKDVIDADMNVDAIRIRARWCAAIMATAFGIAASALLRTADTGYIALKMILIGFVCVPLVTWASAISIQWSRSRLRWQESLSEHGFAVPSRTGRPATRYVMGRCARRLTHTEFEVQVVPFLRAGRSDQEVALLVVDSAIRIATPAIYENPGAHFIADICGAMAPITMGSLEGAEQTVDTLRRGAANQRFLPPTGGEMIHYWRSLDRSIGHLRAGDDRKAVRSALRLVQRPSHRRIVSDAIFRESVRVDV